MKEVRTFVFVLVAGVVAFIYGIFIIGEQLGFPSQVASIEQLRKDAALIDLAASEDVLGQVAEVNRKITSKQRLNELWWADLVIPDGWDDVEFIPIER